MAVNYTDVQKTEKYISRTNFDALEMAAVPEGTEFNIVDQIHESDLDSDVLQKLNNNAKINTANTFTAAQTFKKDITIEGNIIQNGSAYETHAEKLYTKNDMIYTRDGATAALADNAYTGIQAVKYDGTNDGQLVFGKDGVARVGDIGNTQPLATRAEAGALTDGHVLQWDAAGQTLVDSGRTLNEFARVGVDNHFTGENTFTQEVQVQTDNSAMGFSVMSSNGNMFGSLTKDRCHIWDTSEPLHIKNSMLRTEYLQFRIGDITTKYYRNKITYNKKDLLFPETEAGGTFALTKDLPEANPTAEGTVTLTKLKVGDVVYTIPSGGSGGVTSVTTSGTGNAVTGASISGSTLTLTKGTTFLTSHQSLADCAKLSKNNTFSGSNTFTFDETATIGSLFRTLINKSGVSVGAGPKSGVVADTTYGYNGIKQVNTGTTYTYAFPNKSGTFALTSDLNTLKAKLNENIIKDPSKTYLVWKGNQFPNSTNAKFKAPAGCTIDWGDGNVETFSTASTVVNTHNYTDGIEYHLISLFNYASMGNSAFQNCQGLTSVTIGNGVTSIGSFAFDGCSGLTSITIPDSVTYIGISAFQYCSGLTSITIPNSVTSIGDGAFYNCSGLTNVTIPDSVTSIGISAFYGCNGLKTIRISAINPPTLGSNAFEASIEKIIVPKSAINTYKSATGWSTYADKIVYEVDSSDIPSTSNFVTLSGAQTISGNKTFNNHISVHNGPDGYIEVGNWKFFGYSLSNNGTGTSLSFPSGKNGTIAITDDIPIKTATLSDNDTTLTLVLK